MKSNTFEMRVEAELENLSVIGEFVTKVMKQVGADEKSIFEVQLAVDEACANIIQYAYSDEGGTIDIVCRLADDDFVVIVSDRGMPFDPNSVAPPTLEGDISERKVGGLGMFFMREMMDEVSYSFDAEKGNELTMRKKLTQS